MAEHGTTQYLGRELPEHLAARLSAKRRQSGVQWIAIVLVVLSLLVAGALIPSINRVRRDRQLVPDPSTVEGLPPDIQLLGKLGTFRALAIVWAAMRAERLKQEGKHYEAWELHKTVCNLAPRFAKLWSYAAWNMAYNISVTQYTPEERWKWVQDGIRLLRDEGLKYNPRSSTLYKELAWIYWHKIGDYLDDEHLNYKKALAVEMERVLGPPPDALSEQAYFDWFRKIVDAPRDLDKLIESDRDIAMLVERLDGVNLPPDITLLDFVARHMRDQIREEELAADAPEADRLRARRLEILRNPESAESVDRLLAAVRSKVLREEHKFDLDFMYELMVDRYGPLDWRTAPAHSLYWAARGDEVARDHVASDDHDKLNTARLVFMSLTNLTTRGQVILWPDFDDPFKSYAELLPDTRFIPYTYDEYLRLGKELFSSHPKFKEGTPGPVYMNGFVSNMESWIALLYYEGGEKNMKLAEEYLVWLREHNTEPDGSTQQRYLVSIPEFVLGTTPDQIFTFKAINGLLRSFVNRALKHYSLDQLAAGRRALLRGQGIWESWMTQTKIDINDRRKMQPFPLIVRDQVESYLRNRRIDAFAKAKLWHNLPDEIRLPVYDRLAPYFYQLCASHKPPWSVAAAFPEPPGMEAYRANPPEQNVLGLPEEGIERGERY